MSSPRYDWWQSAVWAIRNYPKRESEYEELHRINITAQIGGVPGGHDVSRTTENVALRTMPPMKQIEYEAVQKAVVKTQKLHDADKRIELIRRMYWQGRKKSIYQVIYQVGVSEATGKRWHKRFVKTVGECMGFTEE